MYRRIVAFVFVAILLMALVGVAQHGYRESVRDSQPATTHGKEVWTVDEGNVTTLNNSNQDDLVYAAQADVTVEQTGTTFEAEGNWTWFEHNGTVKAIDGTQLTDGADANITYDTYEPTDEQQLGLTILMFLPETLGGALTLVLGIGILLWAMWLASTEVMR